MLGANVRTGPWLVAAVVLATIALSSFLLASALSTQRQTGAEIRQRFESVLILQRTQALLVDAETGQRGYLLTSNRNYLEPYDRARDELPSQLGSLAKAHVIAPSGGLQALIRAKLQEMASSLQLKADGRRDAAFALVETGKGKAYMDAIRTEIGKLAAQEQLQINSAIQRSERYTVRIYIALALLVASAVALLWLGLAMIMRTQRLEAEAIRLREVELAERRTALIARELNHRVKNLFSIVLAIVQLAGRGANSPKEAVARIGDRIQALARAHDITLGNDPIAGFDLEDLLRTALAPYVSDNSELELTGPEVRLPAMRVTPLGLIMHELATNAMKYGAWSTHGGKVAINWKAMNGAASNGAAATNLQLHWVESGTRELAPDGAAGFGSQLIKAAIGQLNGSLVRERRSHGVEIRIDAPIIEVQAEAGENADES